MNELAVPTKCPGTHFILGNWSCCGCRAAMRSAKVQSLSLSQASPLTEDLGSAHLRLFTSVGRGQGSGSGDLTASPEPKLSARRTSLPRP